MIDFSFIVTDLYLQYQHIFLLKEVQRKIVRKFISFLEPPSKIEPACRFTYRQAWQAGPRPLPYHV